MKPSITERTIKPANCVLAFGIPTSKAVFFEDQQHPNKDFAKRFGGVWERYEYEIMTVFESVKPLMTKLGVEVRTEVTLEQFGHLFGIEQFDVIILFAHWHSKAVEFHSGLVDIPSIVENVPINFDGIIDLCVCHPEALAIALRVSRPNCLVKYVNEKADPAFWLYFYLALFTHMNQHDLGYLTALADVIREFLRKKGKRRNK